jgi:SAM-dependent methyltransferase
MAAKFSRTFGAIKSRLQRLHGSTDDYDWIVYPAEYKAQLSEISRIHTLKLYPGDYSFANGQLVRTREVQPLHPNHRLLYETVLQLRPVSVMEIGCGAGDHLYNLMVLSPKTKLFGCDLSAEQIKFARSRSPDLSADLRTGDITNTVTVRTLHKADVCFTQAVVMHIRSRRRYLCALQNLFSLARNQVILMENWSRHDFMVDIKSLHERRLLAWRDVHFYYRVAPEYGRPHLMVVSAERLSYPVLSEYDVLLHSQTT